MSRARSRRCSAGISLTVIGSLMAGLGVIFHPDADLNLLLLIIGTSLAFNGMMFLMMVRVDDPLVPRAMFGVLNTLLFFPSGAISPVAAFPKWLRAIALRRSVYATRFTGSKRFCSRMAGS